MISGRRKIAGAIAGITGLFAVQGCSDQQAQAADSVSVAVQPASTQPKHDPEWTTPDKDGFVKSASFASGDFLRANHDALVLDLRVGSEVLGSGREDELITYLEGRLAERFGPGIKIKSFKQKPPVEGIKNTLFMCSYYSNARGGVDGVKPFFLDEVEGFINNCVNEYTNKEKIELALN